MDSEIHLNKHHFIHKHHWINKIALVNAVVSAFALYPQLYTLITTGGNGDGLSVISFSLVLSNSIIWFWYGHHLKALPLMISSFFNAIAAATILILIN